MFPSNQNLCCIMRILNCLFVAVSFVIGMVGCGPRASDADDAQVPTVRLSMDEAPLADTVAGRLFRNPSYVTLRGRMLGSISQLLDWRDRYVIFDRKQNYVYLFDTTGQFIRQVGQVGKGPREYVRLSGVALAGDTLVFYADQPNKLMYYDRAGDFLGERPIARRYCFLEGIGYGGADGRVYGVMPANRGTSGYTVARLTEDETDGADFLPFKEWPAAVTAGAILTAADSGVLWISRPFDNRVYRVDRTNGEPRAVFRLDFGAGNMPAGYTEGLDDYDVILKASKEGIVFHAARPCQVGDRLLIGTFGNYFLIDLADGTARKVESIAVGDGVEGQFWSYVPMEYQSRRLVLQLIPERVQALAGMGRMKVTPQMDSLLQANGKLENPILMIYELED